MPRFRKVYGKSQIRTCPFCDKQAISQNSQKIPTCHAHKTQTLGEMKCMCGSWLDLQKGKYGPFFTCFKCGTINWRKAMEINGKQQATTFKVQKKTGTIQKRATPIRPSFGRAKVEKRGNETVIRSDELDFI